MDVAEDGAGGEDTEEDDKTNSGKGDKRDTPEGEALDKVQRAAVMIVCMGGKPAGNAAVGVDVHGHGGDQQGQGGEDRDNGDVLGQEDGKDAATATGLHEALFGQGLQHDGGGGEGECEADGKADAPRLFVGKGNAHDGKGRQDNLEPAEAEKLVAHGPEGAGFKLEPDQEEHHDHAEFGNVLERLGFRADKAEGGPNQKSGSEIAKNGSKAQAGGNGHGDDSGRKVDCGLR